jgi:hypothetical protein
MKLENLTLESVKKAVLSKGYSWFLDKVNIVGIRTNNNTPDAWNDFLCIEFKGIFYAFKGTTRPGVYWLQHPMREEGTFVMAPGQYVDCWQKGLHSGYPALVQCKPVKGYRDKDKDNIVDPDTTKIYLDGQGVDIHHAHKFVTQSVIDKYSAGCQVIDKYSDWCEFFELYGESNQTLFSYTLILEGDIK